MSLAQTSTAVVGTIDTSELRAELKTWEHDFLAAHGRKPAKSDIKANHDMGKFSFECCVLPNFLLTDVATKYKLYDKLARRLPSTSTRPAASVSNTASTTPTKKRKRDTHRDSGVAFIQETEAVQVNPPTPQRKNLKADGTVHPADIDPYDPPLNTFFSPLTQRTFVAPTPQKNGRVLGIFDLLSPESARKATPSKRRDGLAAGTPSRHAVGVSGTPSRARISTLDLLSATPSRRADLAAGPRDALTPSKNRANGVVNTPSLQRTKRLDLEDTPDCLRRYPKRAPTPPPGEGASTTTYCDADGMMNMKWSPIQVRQPRKKFGRSFSELAKDIRRREEKKLDFEDELDVLRDLEGEEMGAPNPPKRSRSSLEGDGQDAAQPLGRDIPIPKQAPVSGDLPLGPDGDHEIDRSDAENDDEPQDSQMGPRRWKKKGPKRQTKKFNIRPTHNVKWKPEAKWEGGVDKESENENEEQAFDLDDGANDVVLETQVIPKPGALGSDNEGSVFESEDELVSEHEALKSKAAKKLAKKTDKSAAKVTKTKPAKTIKATAHANFRSLKIKNKNSKAKGRFGRRRG